MTDNKNIGLKSKIRSTFLPEHANVLDLACGYGEMYRRVYKNKADYYLGIDKKKIHDPNHCIIDDNNNYLKQHSIDIFNTFDVDSYGSPWELVWQILKKSPLERITIFITDGLVFSLKRGNKATRLIATTEMIPKTMKIPSISRFYPDIINTMIFNFTFSFGWNTSMAKYTFNTGATVCYLVLKLEKGKVYKE